jgi:hypothetical protein
MIKEKIVKKKTEKTKNKQNKTKQKAISGAPMCLGKGMSLSSQ